MKKVLIVMLILLVPSISKADDLSWWEKIVYPQEVTNNTLTVSVQKTWAWKKDVAYEGFIASFADKENFVRFHIEVSFSEAIEDIAVKQSLELPDGIRLMIGDFIDVDIGGMPVGSVTARSSRTEILVSPMISMPVYQVSPKWSIREGLKPKFETRLGLGYQLNNYVEETNYKIHIFDIEEASADFTLPYTDSGIIHGVAMGVMLNATLGILHVETQHIYYTPSGYRFLLGIGVQW
jgi:hypothetical protein